MLGIGKGGIIRVEPCALDIRVFAGIIGQAETFSKQLGQLYSLSPGITSIRQLAFARSNRCICPLTL